ncbi:hypothetical protein M407DRAFT_243047 [Tulasnella calospora MUT 4182]|uniref:Uncharacterized protein n=1 Tax=Tulasnella calospora MUT 4182 TaxID=1051891 RepID=A0A0C3L3T3_9AGAM|nr:hypothetical protein M407DRAFT_243047 [Tulasnella calospora MUT 4182]
MEDEPSANGHSGRRSRVRRSVNSVIDSLVEEGKLEEPVTCLISRPGGFFDQKDCLAVIQYLAENPSLFYGPVEVPLGATSTKAALWEKFTAKHKTRSHWSWTEFHRLHKVALENAARKLISIRQAREGRDGLQEPSSSSTIHTNVIGQPSTLTSMEQPTRPGFLSRFQNLLKRSFRDDAESSSPSKRIKLEESLS